MAQDEHPASSDLVFKRSPFSSLSIIDALSYLSCIMSLIPSSGSDLLVHPLHTLLPFLVVLFNFINTVSQVISAFDPAGLIFVNDTDSAWLEPFYSGGNSITDRFSQRAAV